MGIFDVSWHRLPKVYNKLLSPDSMGVTPEVAGTFARNVIQANCPDLAQQLLAQAMGAYIDQLRRLTGHKILTGEQPVVKFRVKRRVYQVKHRAQPPADTPVVRGAEEQSDV